MPASLEEICLRPSLLTCQVVEIAPAFGLDEKVRKAVHESAVKLCKFLDYQNAGTVEFMVDKNGDYYFLEVNPRIQVISLCKPKAVDLHIGQSLAGHAEQYQQSPLRAKFSDHEWMIMLSRDLQYFTYPAPLLER